VRAKQEGITGQCYRMVRSLDNTLRELAAEKVFELAINNSHKMEKRRANGLTKDSNSWKVGLSSFVLNRPEDNRKRMSLT